MKIAHSKTFVLPLPQHHRFPMIKYELIPEQLLYEGTVSSPDFFEPVPISFADASFTHDEDYLTRLLSRNLTRDEERRSGFPQTEAMVEREFLVAGATYGLCEFALTDGIAFSTSGGTHHAYADKPEGFCLLNDIAIAANILRLKHQIKKILVIDLDVHQGNGTAHIFANEPRVFTFSMHGEDNFPHHKETSDLDIPLKNGITDEDYLNILSDTLPKLITRVQPEFVFYQAGVDVLKTDKLGKLSLTLAGCKQRDKMVLKSLQYANIPTVVTMGGGYSTEIKDIVEAHCNTFRVANELYG